LSRTEADPVVLQKMLRQSNVDTTMLYIHNAQKALDAQGKFTGQHALPQTLTFHLPKTGHQGEIVLPCKPRYPPRDKSFCQGRCAAELIFGQVILWTRISRMDELC
jgi:hypothetical protein